MVKRSSPQLAAACSLMVACVVGATVSGSAHAELGGTVASVESDAAHLKGVVRLAPAQAYTLHEIEAATGHIVREYAADDGKIFGVGWEGPTVPDLRQLLGEQYFTKFQQAVAKRQSHRRGPVVIETSDFVFEQTGRLRDFRGRAYLPRAMPSGVSIGMIR